MLKPLFATRAAAVGMILATIASAPALAKPAALPSQAAAAAASSNQHQASGKSGNGQSPADTSSCAPAAFSQPFAAFGDLHWYTLAPGQAVNDFSGTGWTLSGGAATVNMTLNDGTSAQVLDLPAGSSAVSPPMCVASNYPTGRAMLRDVHGAGGVHFAVSYQGTKSWSRPRDTGLVHAHSTSWALSARFGIQPSHASGWQIVRFRLSVPAHGGEFALYNLYVDPFMRK